MNIHKIVDHCEKKISWCTNDRERHCARNEIIDFFYEDLLHVLACSLNKIHDTNYPKRYWHILLGSWLYEFSSVVYDRKKLIDGYSEEYEIEDICLESRIIPRNIYESLKLAEVDEFNAQLFNDIKSEKINNEIPESNYEKKLKFNTEVNFETKIKLKEVLFNFFLNKLVLKNNVVVSVTAIPLISQLKIFLKWPGIRPIKPLKDSPSNFNIPANINYREKISLDFKKVNSKNKYLKMILKLMPFYIPKSFIEGFQKLELLTNRYKSLPKAIIFTTEFYGRCESFINWAAKCSLKGTRICSMQHGGNYGFEYRAEYDFVEIGPSDIFYTWGWLWPKYRIPVKKLRKMPSFHLSSNTFKKQIHKENKILFCSTSIDKTLRSLGPCGGDTYYKNQYIKNQLKLYEYLNDDVKKIFHIRLYKDDLIGLNKMWSQHYPDAIFEDMKVDFLTNLSDASLFVADHMSTTWIEALAYDIPIMVYINIGSYEMTREMQLIIDMLQKVSVIHYDIKSLTDAINKNFNNTEEWWNEKERAETIRIARNELIYSSQSIIDKWSYELKKL